MQRIFCFAGYFIDPLNIRQSLTHLVILDRRQLTLMFYFTDCLTALCDKSLAFCNISRY